MPTRREMLRLGPGLMVVFGATVAGCVAYPPPASQYPAYPADSGYPPPPPASWNPNMVWLQSPDVYVALGLTVPLFFDGGSYYSNYGGRWYSGPTYRGPWRYRQGPPQSLHDFHPNAWGGYQDRARGYYQGNPNWKHFKPPH